MGMNRADAYYEPSDNDDEDRIEEAVSDLMKDEYDPTTYSNFAEAISEANQDDRDIIEQMLKKPNADMDYEAIGRKLFCMAYEYMEKYAISKAEDQLASGYLD